MNMLDLIDEKTDDGGYDDSGNMFVPETINEMTPAGIKRIIE